MPRHTITIGADPELFLKRGTEFVSAIDKIGGTKLAPRPLGRRAGFKVQEDNVAAEFNIPPARSEQAFVNSIHWSIKQIGKEVKAFECEPAIIASAVFPEIELEHPLAQQFGCDPDFNAWKTLASGKLYRNPRPHATDPCLRSCGGHIHVGFQKDTLDPIQLITWMDLFLGVPSVMMDEDDQRRRLYGKAGAFRLKNKEQDGYNGVEYRVLSNFWLRTKELTSWAYQQTHRAVQHAIKYKTAKAWTKYMSQYELQNDIQKCINRGSLRLSHALIVNYNLLTV